MKAALLIWAQTLILSTRAVPGIPTVISGQGKEKVKDFLRENPEIAQEIEAKIRAVTIAKSDNKEAAEEPLQDVESIFKE